MNENNIFAYREWLKKAEEDELSLAVIIQGEGASSTACFLAQQMTEKLLKALLVLHNQRFQKVHDLISLATTLQAIVPDIVHLQTDLKLLTRFYVETRYPGDYPEFSRKDAEEAHRAALRVKEFVTRQANAKF